MNAPASVQSCRPAAQRPAGNQPSSRRAARRGALIGLAMPVASTLVYFAARPAAGSDAAGLAIAGAVPAACTVAFALVRHRVDPWSAVTALGYALACVASLLAGGSSLPMKLPEAAITFILGVILLGAVLLRRPLPVARVLKVPAATRATDTALGAIVGAFLILHALLNLALALSMSTSAYLTTGRLVNWGVIALGVLALWTYVRHLRSAAS